jgi:N-carbamoyl-D-amino-acid hydrolase
MAAGAYQNATWVVGVAKGGVEEGVEGLYKRTVFDFDRYRRPEMYARITSQRGIIEPEEPRS